MTPSLVLIAIAAFQQEVTFSVGAHGGGDKSTNAAWQANYSAGLKKGDKAALFGEIHVLASPNRVNQLRDLFASRDEAALFVTPGLGVRFVPRARVSPFVSMGYGLGVYEQSQLLQNGAPFPGSRSTKHGAWQYGGGVDVLTLRWLALRGDFRNFYSDGRNNPVASVGFQLRFGAR